MKDDSTTTVATLREIMRQFVSERNWEAYHTPKNLSMALAAEVGELLEHFQWLTAKEIDRKLRQPAFRTAVQDEISDVLMYLLSLANAIEMDVATSMQSKMEKNRRKYPKEKFHGHYERPL